MIVDLGEFVRIDMCMVCAVGTRKAMREASNFAHCHHGKYCNEFFCLV